MKRLMISMTVALGLSACSSSPPVHYYTLLGPAIPSSAPAPAQGRAPFLIELLAVGIPAQLDQAQLVVHEGDGSIALLDDERWAGPFADEVRGSLSAELTRLLGTQDIAGLARPAGKPLLRIKVQVRRFDAWPGQQVQLDADWSIGVADDSANARLTCHGRVDQPATDGYPGLVAAQRQAIAALAVRIAADARAWAGTRTAACSGA
ncbi:MAG TPA: PqiC family protein [Telluria sp.]